jgi:hypothetical protein
MTLLTINTIKKHAIAKDGADLTLTIDAKHVGELSVPIPGECFDELLSALTRAKSMAATKPDTRSDQVSVKVAKNCRITADVGRGLVILVFDHQTPDQAGYALDTDAAMKTATGLVKSSDAVRTKQSGQKGVRVPVRLNPAAVEKSAKHDFFAGGSDNHESEPEQRERVGRSRAQIGSDLEGRDDTLPDK